MIQIRKKPPKLYFGSGDLVVPVRWPVCPLMSWWWASETHAAAGLSWWTSQTGAHVSCYFYVKPGTRVHTASGLKGPIKILWFPWQQHEVGAGSSSPPWCPSFTPTEVQFTVQKIRQAAARTSSAAEGKLRSQPAEDAPRPQMNPPLVLTERSPSMVSSEQVELRVSGSTVILTGNVKITKFSSVFLNWSARAVPADVSTPFSSRLTWQFHVSEVKYDFVVLFSFFFFLLTDDFVFQSKISLLLCAD